MDNVQITEENMFISQSANSESKKREAAVKTAQSSNKSTIFRGKKPEIKSNLNKFKKCEARETIYIVDYDSGEKKKMITSFYGQSKNHLKNDDYVL